MPRPQSMVDWLAGGRKQCFGRGTRVKGALRRPSFTGLLLHEDRRYGFALWLPDGWYRLGLDGSEHGVMYVPDPADTVTGVAVEPAQLPATVRRGDLATLRAGMLDGIRALPHADLEQHSAELVGSLLTLEARFTYEEAGATRKRWVRLLYQRKTQLRLIAQAAQPEVFDYWESMFCEAMRTVHFLTG